MQKIQLQNIDFITPPPPPTAVKVVLSWAGGLAKIYGNLQLKILGINIWIWIFKFLICETLDFKKQQKIFFKSSAEGPKKVILQQKNVVAGKDLSYSHCHDSYSQSFRLMLLYEIDVESTGDSHSCRSYKYYPFILFNFYFRVLSVCNMTDVS